MIMAEVNNTFGETANYWLTPSVERPVGDNKRYRFSKAFHVSPFLKLGHRIRLDVHAAGRAADQPERQL
jgi:DUF1365 family protein